MIRSIFFGSSVLSVTIVTLIWRLVYLPDRGLLSGILGFLGLPPVEMVSSESLALPAIAIVTVWWIIGLPMTLFLAALQQIPPELYEAAALDRASRPRTLLAITLPSIRRTVVMVAVETPEKAARMAGSMDMAGSISCCAIVRESPDARPGRKA